jgi:hypothetical protein
MNRLKEDTENDGMNWFWAISVIESREAADAEIAEMVAAVEALDFGCVRWRTRGKEGRVHALRRHAG